MASLNKLALLNICFAFLAISCSEGANSSEKNSNVDKTQVTTPTKPEPASQKQEAAKDTQEITPCTEVFLTGTGGGPAAQFGNAQSGVFIRSGNTGNGCNAERLQFDAGRGTLLKLSLIPAPARPGFVTPPSLSALFLTHGHSDHTSSISDILETRWIMTKNDGQFPDLKPPRPKYKDFPVICFDETCDIVETALVPWEGEISERAKKDHRLSKPGADVRKFSATDAPQLVWNSDTVSVSAVSVDHIEGSVGFLVETAAGNVCVSGDTSFSENFNKMCEDAEVIIHEVIHSVMDGIANKVPSPDPTFTKVMDNIYKSHTSTTSFSKFTDSDSLMVLTHIIPPIGAGGFQGIPLVPHLNKMNPDRKTGPIRADDFCKSIRDSGFKGPLHVGTDLMHIKLSGGDVSTSAPDKKVTACE